MLNKTVCQACINTMAHKPIEEGQIVEYPPPDWLHQAIDSGDAFKPKFGGWSGLDESFWHEEIVKCRVIPAAKTDINGKPPRWCRYAMEHIVCEGTK